MNCWGMMNIIVIADAGLRAFSKMGQGEKNNPI